MAWASCWGRWWSRASHCRPPLSSRPLADFLDLDGHWLLAHDPFRGAPGERGAITLSDRPGLGVERAR
jgi:L-alanine-DL-glutamate epimerase-like enolase superfamily enzyme